MTNFTTRKQFLIPTFDLNTQEREKLDRFLRLLEKSKVDELFRSKKNYESLKGGRPAYNSYDMLATILYGFAFRSATLRGLESSCKYDLRYFYLMQQERPSHMSFHNFINKSAVPDREKINGTLMRQITKSILFLTHSASARHF